MGSEDWKAMPVGDFIPDWDNNQLVGIKIAKCGGDTTLWSLKLHFKVKKSSADKIAHVYQEGPN